MAITVKHKDVGNQLSQAEWGHPDVHDVGVLHDHSSEAEGGSISMSHDELTGVTPDQHHTKYTDDEAVAAAEVAGLALASGKRINIIQALSGDHTWSGITATLTAGENLVIGDAVYAKDDGKMWKADADAATTMPVIGLATGPINADAEGEFLLLGYMRDDSWAWTVGGYLYGSVTPGNPTQTAPTGAGDQVQILGIAITADILYFNPSLELVEISA